jgi:hypothetical protein
LSTRYNFALWLAGGKIFGGWSRSVSGNTAEGIAWIEDGIREYRAAGSMLRMPYYLGSVPKMRFFPCSTRCKMLHCKNFEMKTLFLNVVNCFGWKEGKFAPARETPLALSFDSNLFGFVT